jgi:hypothetical protein
VLVPLVRHHHRRASQADTSATANIRQTLFSALLPTSALKFTRAYETPHRVSSQGTAVPRRGPRHPAPGRRPRAALGGRSRRGAARAGLLRRIFELDPLRCPRCGHAMRVVAFITEPPVIDRILTHLRCLLGVSRVCPRRWCLWMVGSGVFGLGQLKFLFRGGRTRPADFPGRGVQPAVLWEGQLKFLFRSRHRSWSTV